MLIGESTRREVHMHHGAITHLVKWKTNICNSVSLGFEIRAMTLTRAFKMSVRPLERNDSLESGLDILSRLSASVGASRVANYLNKMV